jgi:hypothetical protein
MTFRSLLALSLPLGFTLACGALQSYSAGLQVICDAPNTCADCATATAENRQMRMARHIEDQLWNPSATELFTALAYADPETRVEMLRQEAQANGIQTCALADEIDNELREARQMAVQKICAISTDCSAFDAADPSTLQTCLDILEISEETIPDDVRQAIIEMDSSSSATVAAGLQKLAAANGHPACAAAAAYRNP